MIINFIFKIKSDIWPWPMTYDLGKTNQQWYPNTISWEHQVCSHARWALIVNSYSTHSVCPSVHLSRPPNGQSLQGLKSVVALSTACAARGLGVALGAHRNPRESPLRRTRGAEPLEAVAFLGIKSIFLSFGDNNSFKVSLHGILTPNPPLPPIWDFFFSMDLHWSQNWPKLIPRGWIRPIGWKFGGLLSVTLLLY